MKLYYLEDDIYPATYCFKNEAVGTSGTDIDFVDAATLYNGACEIVSDWQSHKKVLRLLDDITAAEDPQIIHNDTQATAGTREFWIGTNDITEDWRFIFMEDASVLLHTAIRGSELQYHDGAWQSIQAVSNNVLYHCKFIWRADNTFDFWVDGIKKLDNIVLLNNQVSGYNKFRVEGRGDSTDYLYFDAWGDPDNDTNYNVGDNFMVDWHDPYNKEEIVNIVEYPIISTRLDAYTICNTVINNFEGELFDDWNDRDFNKILIEDDSDNILFRGYLIKKIFTSTSMQLFFAGIGILLDWEHFGSEGVVDYIKAEGLIKAPISNNSILQVKDDDGNDFTWDPDWWIKEGLDLGLLIVDKTDVNTRTWDSSAISQEGGTVIAGNNASTTEFNDSDFYNVKESTITPGNPITFINLTIDGIAVDDTDFLKSIQIEYSFRFKIVAGIIAYNWGRVYLEIFNGTDWEPINNVGASRYIGSHTTGWCMGIPLDIDGGNGAQKLIEKTDTELRLYFNKTGATYTSLKGLRFRTTGDLKTDSYFYVHVDFINVVVGYMSDDISPVMESITDSTATSLTCGQVSAWDEMGVIENDGFKIGQNTTSIINDIASESGLDISIQEKDVTSFVVPDGDITADWSWPIAGTHYDNIDEHDGSPDVQYIEARNDEGDNLDVEEFTFSTLYNIVRGSISEFRVYLYGKNDGVGAYIGVDLSWDGGANWDGYQTIGAELWTSSYAWQYKTFTPTEADLTKLRIRIKAAVTDANMIMKIKTVYVEFDYKQNDFTKYMARKFKGNYCMEPLKSVCKLEGAHWYEDYINNQIVIVKPAILADSEVDLTEADYAHAWEYEDDCNQIRSFYVFGKAEDNIFAKAVDNTVKGYISKQLIDEGIATIGDAQEIADEQLALLNTKRPSIRLPLDGVNTALQLGTTVDVTFARPTIAKTAYPIRKIERSRKGIDEIKTVIWCGLGESTEMEKIGKIIRDNAFRSHKGLTDRLISP